MSPAPKGLHELAQHHKTIIFLTVLGGVFMSVLDATIVATALPDIIVALGGFQQYTLVATIYLIGSIVAIPITGRLIDIYGRKWFYIAGISVFVIGSLLSGLSTSMMELIIFRGIQGFGAGMMIANAFTIIADLYPPSERGKYQSYISIIFGLSSIIGPLAGGIITDSIGWEWIFFINIPIGIVIILLFLRYLPVIRPAEKERIDYAGIALLVATIVPLLLALSWGGVQYPWASGEIIGMLAFSTASGIALFLVDRKAAHAVIPFSLFSNPIIYLSIIITFLLGFAMYAGIIFIPLWFQGVQGETATASGTYLTPLMVGLVIGAFFSGQALSRLGGHYKLQGIMGIVILATGMWFLASMKINTSYFLSVIYMVVAGLGLGITFPLYSTAIQNVTPLKRMGVAISSVPFWRFTGGAIGLALLGTVVTNTFAADFIANLPASIKEAVPAPVLSGLAHNLHGLVGQGPEQLKNLLGQYVSNPNQAFAEVVLALRESLNTAVTTALLVGFAVSAATLGFQLFLKEIPLKRTHASEEEPGGNPRQPQK